MTTNNLPAHLDPSKKHDFFFLWDVVLSNPNGDPDNGNRPRTLENGRGLVTNQCIKHKIRSYVNQFHGDDEGLRIYIDNHGIPLNTLHLEAYTALGLDYEKLADKGAKKGAGLTKGHIDAASAWMDKAFWDIRMFGAVGTTAVNVGTHTGPVQIDESQSADPVTIKEICISRCAVTKPGEALSEGGDGNKVNTLGRKFLVEYGLYLGKGSYNPMEGEGRNISWKDMELFWEALREMFVYDQSANRTEQNLRGIVIFTHDNLKGVAKRHVLENRFTVAKRDGVAVPQSFMDYTWNVNAGNLPKNITLTVIDEKFENPDDAVQVFTASPGTQQARNRVSQESVAGA